MNQYYTAAQAAEILGLKYPTFMARVKKGQYTYSRVGGWTIVFDKDYIDQIAIEQSVDRGAPSCS